MVSIELQRSILTNSNKLQLSIILPIFIIGHVSQNMIGTNYDENLLEDQYKSSEKT